MTRKYTQKALRRLVAHGLAVDITNADNAKREELLQLEGRLDKIGWSQGIYGCNGLLLSGFTTGTLYAVTARTAAVFIFG